MLELEHVLYGCVCNNTIIGQLITMRHSRLIVRSKRVYPTLIVIFVCCMYVLILCRYCKPKSGIRHNIIRKMRGLIAYQIFILLFNSGKNAFFININRNCSCASKDKGSVGFVTFLCTAKICLGRDLSYNAGLVCRWLVNSNYL